MTKYKESTKLNTKRVAIVLAILLLVVVAILLRNRSVKNSVAEVTPKTSAPTASSVPTYKAQSEGQSIDVPTNVDPSAIKNYTLITENEQFKIRELDGNYVITLYAIVNRPDQADWYRDQLREYKQNALDYLKQQGVDTAKVKITYEPEEATNL